MAKIVIDKVASYIRDLATSLHALQTNHAVRPHGIILPGYKLAEAAQRFRSMHLPIIVQDTLGEAFHIRHGTHVVNECQVWRGPGRDVWFQRYGRSIDYSWENLAWLMGNYSIVGGEYVFDIDTTQQLFIKMKPYKRHTMLTFHDDRDQEVANELGFCF